MTDKAKIWIWLDPTNFCNLSCRLCYTKPSHGKNFMSKESFKTIIDKLYDNELIEPKFLHLNWRGEPFANSSIVYFISYLNDKEINSPVHLHTNGTLFTEEIISELCNIDFKIDFTLYFSLDGDSKKKHEFNRGRKSYDKTINNLNQFLGKNRNFKVGIYEIVIGGSTNMIYNDIKGHVDLHKKVDPIYPDEHELSLFKGSAMAYTGYNNIENINSVPDFPVGPCVFAGNTLAIDAKGNVSVCILSNTNEGIIGNLLYDDVSTIVDKGHHFRNSIINIGRNNVPHCQKCLKPNDPNYINSNYKQCKHI